MEEVSACRGVEETRDRARRALRAVWVQSELLRRREDTHLISSTVYPIRTSARNVIRSCSELWASIAAVGGSSAVQDTAGTVRESTR